MPALSKQLSAAKDTIKKLQQAEKDFEEKLKTLNAERDAAVNGKRPPAIIFIVSFFYVTLR